jgi:large subunit ribosomal protein L25
MKTIEISGNLRNDLGKKHAKSARREGQVPCVLYGIENPIHFQVDERSFKHLIYSPEAKLVQLNVDGNKHEAVMKEVQFHPVTDKIVHVDFLKTESDKVVAIQIPVKPVGTSIGVLRGGMLAVSKRKLTVKGVPTSLPEEIEINITKLKIGDKLRVKDLKTEGLQFTDPPSTLVIAVKSTRAALSTTTDDEEADDAAVTETATEEAAS